MAEDVKLKITADNKDAKDKLGEIEDKAVDLERSLSTAAQIAGAAFATFTGVIIASLHSFRESEVATNELNNSLKNQGIFSRALSNEYKQMASELQKVTIFGDDQIVSAQAQIQAHLGQTAVTREITQATLDFATAKKIDLKNAAEIVGKAISGNTDILKRYGVEGINPTASSTEKLASVTNVLSREFGGSSQAMADGLGVITQIKGLFGELFEEIGKRLAPTVADIGKRFKAFFQNLLENEALLDLITNILKVGTVLSGTGLAIVAAGLAWIKFQSVMQLALPFIKTLTFSLRGLAGATGIGLVIVALSMLALNWEKSIAFISSSWNAFIQLFGTSLSALKGFIFNFFSSSFSPEVLNEHAQNFMGAFTVFRDQFVEAMSRYRDEDVAKKNTQNQQDIELEKAQKAMLLALDAETKAKLKVLDDTFFNEETKARNIFLNNIAVMNKKQQKEEIDELTKKLQTRQQLEENYITEKINETNSANARFFKMETDHGKAIATADRFFNSEKIENTKWLGGQMTTLMRANSRALFNIGKSASQAIAAIDMAQAIVKALAAFPPPFNFGAAAAVAAAGAVQISLIARTEYKGAAEGALVEGGIPGRDSVPFMLTPGELVTPAKNFDEVVNAVARDRLLSDESGGGSGFAHIVLEINQE